jgi:hypothetical protein
MRYYYFSKEMSPLYFGLDVFCQQKLESRNLRQCSVYSGRKKYSAWLAKVPYILSVITIATDEVDSSSFFYLKDICGLYTHIKKQIISFNTFCKACMYTHP